LLVHILVFPVTQPGQASFGPAKKKFFILFTGQKRKNFLYSFSKAPTTPPAASPITLSATSRSPRKASRAAAEKSAQPL
jgi:hypothetical protein